MPAESWISAGIYQNTRNKLEWPEIFPKWNMVSYCFGLFTGTVFSGRYGQNGMELITLNQT